MLPLIKIYDAVKAYEEDKEYKAYDDVPSKELVIEVAFIVLYVTFPPLDIDLYKPI